MAKDKMDELFTPYTQQAALAEPRPPRVVRVYPVTSYGGRTLYYMNGLPFPVPAVLRRLDGVRVRTLALALAVALALACAGVWRALG